MSSGDFSPKQNGPSDVSDDVTTTKAIRRVNDKMFSVLILLCQQVTHNKTICEGKSV